MKNVFIAKPCNFKGEKGYIIDQYHEGLVLCSQFVPESSFAYFCKVSGIIPKIEDLAE